MLSFIPPDGKFTLMEYTIGGNMLLPISVKPTVSFGKDVGRVEPATTTGGLTR